MTSFVTEDFLIDLGSTLENYPEINPNRSVNDDVSYLTSIFINTLDKHAPLKSMSRREIKLNAKPGSAPRGDCPPNRHTWTPPINKLNLLKAVAFVLNFKLCPPPDKRLASLRRLLCRRLWAKKWITKGILISITTGNRLFNSCYQCQDPVKIQHYKKYRITN